MWDEPEPELSHGTVIRYNIGYKQVRTKPNQIVLWKQKIRLTFSLEQRARTSSMTWTDMSGIRPGTFPDPTTINNPPPRFNFRLRRLQKFTKYEIVVQVPSSVILIPTDGETLSGQAVNAHGEGPLSDIVVGQTTESGEERNNEQIGKMKNDRPGDDGTLRNVWLMV